jgi:hypothetical protein
VRLPRKVILERIETDYLRAQIDTGDNARIKSALQSLCKSYRSGLTVGPDQLTSVVNAIVGTAYQPTIDEKVRRWVLNALARMAREVNGIPAVLHLLKGISFDPQMRTLAALQHVPPGQLDLRALPIDIESASVDVLKLALVVVGLARSPDNLLNPRHGDGEMVRALGKHDDAIVSQYTIWAITENDKLGLANLGVEIKEIESQPDNVRAWMLQLLAMEANDNRPHWEVLRLGMGDPAAEARRGLALGMKSTFVDIFEPMVLDWIVAEPDAEVRQHLLHHIVRHAHRSRSYEQYAVETYDGEPRGSMLRRGMEANAARLPIYTRFKEIDAGAFDLFGGRSVTMVEKQYNIGSVQGGAVNVGDGTATNYGATSVQVLTSQQVEIAQGELAKLEAALHGSSLGPAEKGQALEYVKSAKDDPSPGKIGKVVEFIGHLGSIAEAGTALAPYATALGAVIGLS